MTQVRPLQTLLAAAATLLVLSPMTSLFTPDSWYAHAVVVVAGVGALGAAVRALHRSRSAVVITQAVVAAYALAAVFAGDTFSWLLPTRETVEQLGGLGAGFLETVRTSAAPAPLSPAVEFYLLAGAALVAICVDAAAVTFDAPAASGLPLLAAYLVTAANGSQALPALSFLPPVLVWLLMLHVRARRSFVRWGTTQLTPSTESQSAAPPDEDRIRREGRRSGWRLTSSAAKVAVLGVLAALLLPAFMPHFPTRYLTEGLGRTGEGVGDGTVGFSDTLDLTRSLRNTDPTPVLRYTTTGFDRGPLRVTTVSHYSGYGEWGPAAREFTGLTEPLPLPPVDQRIDYEIDVIANSLRDRLAVPYPVVAVATEGVPWQIDPVTRDVLVEGVARNYRVVYADLAPAPPLLRQSGEPDSPDVLADDLRIPDTARALVREWASTVTAGRDNPLDKAIAIQDHLRDTSRYTYSLDLGEPLRDESGRPVEAVRAFYETRTGYCAQFATAMIFLARAEGIPARMAIGFLPGNREGAEYVVRQSDAHAWPELYFEGFGWLRFEPTPGSRSGSPPPYAVAGSDVGGGAGRDVDATDSTATPSAGESPEPLPTTAADGGAGADRSWFAALDWRDLLVLVVVVLVVVAVFAMPLTAWLVRTRRRRAAVTRQDLIEAEWQDLESHLGDLGLDPPTGATLRQWREHFITRGHLDPDNAERMRRVTATLERARYDRPDRTTPEQTEELHRDIRAIRRRVARTRAWRTRLRSFLWPSTGVETWRRLTRRDGGGRP